MDYDATDIPVAYDRGRDHGPEVLNLWMNVVSSSMIRQSSSQSTFSFFDRSAFHYSYLCFNIDARAHFATTGCDL